MITSVYYSCYTCRGNENIYNVDEVRSSFRENVKIVQVNLKGDDVLYDDQFGESFDGGNDENTRPTAITGPFKIPNNDEEIPDLKLGNNLEPRGYNDERSLTKQVQYKRQMHSRERNALELEKNKTLCRSDHLYMLGKKSICKRRERHYHQMAEETKRNAKIERSLEKKRILNRTSVNSSSSRTRAIQLYELSRPKQIEGKLRRQRLLADGTNKGPKSRPL